MSFMINIGKEKGTQTPKKRILPFKMQVLKIRLFLNNKNKNRSVKTI